MSETLDRLRELRPDLAWTANPMPGSRRIAYMGMGPLGDITITTQNDSTSQKYWYAHVCTCSIPAHAEIRVLPGSATPEGALILLNTHLVEVVQDLLDTSTGKDTWTFRTNPPCVDFTELGSPEKG